MCKECQEMQEIFDEDKKQLRKLVKLLLGNVEDDPDTLRSISRQVQETKVLPGTIHSFLLGEVSEVLRLVIETNRPLKEALPYLNENGFDYPGFVF